MALDFTWLISGLAIVGVILNIYKNKWCFIVWTCTNAFWMVYDYRIGATAQAALFAVYFALAIWGLAKWSKGGHREETKLQKLNRQFERMPKLDKL